MRKKHTKLGIWQFKVSILIKYRLWNEVISVYVIDDICYAGTDQHQIKVVEVKPLVGRMLLITFSSGERRLFDTTKLTC